MEDYTQEGQVESNNSGLTPEPELQSDPESASRHVWSNKSIWLLIKLYKAHQHIVDIPGKKMRDMWEEIAKGMIAKGFSLVTSFACDSKWRNLKGSYKTALKNRCQHPGLKKRRSTWDYFDAFHQIYGGDSSVTEVTIASSLMNKRPRLENPDSDSAETGNLSAHAGQRFLNNHSGTRSSNVLPKWLREYMKKQQEINEKKLTELINVQNVMCQLLKEKNELLKELHGALKSLMDA